MEASQVIVIAALPLPGILSKGPVIVFLPLVKTVVRLPVAIPLPSSLQAVAVIVHEPVTRPVTIVLPLLESIGPKVAPLGPVP